MAAPPITQPIAAKADATIVGSRAEMSGGEPVPAEPIPTKSAQTSPVQIALILLGAIAFLYFSRPVILPVVLAGIAGMTLKPLMRWLSFCHLPLSLSAAVVVGLLVAVNPVVIFVSLIFWTWLWGVSGALLSVPILVSLKVISDHVPAMSPVSELLSR